MKKWQDYLQEAEKQLNVTAIREELKSLLEKLHERGFLTSLKYWEVKDFPYLQADGGTPFAEKMLALVSTDPIEIDGVSVDEYVWGYMNAPDIIKTGLSLFIEEEGKDRFTIARFLADWRLYWQAAEIGGRPIFISLHEGYYPPQEEEEE